jgi:hypothetical protein
LRWREKNVSLFKKLAAGFCFKMVEQAFAILGFNSFLINLLNYIKGIKTEHTTVRRPSERTSGEKRFCGRNF